MDTSITPQDVKPARIIPPKPEWLRAEFVDLAIDPVRVDRDNRILNGYVVAQEGPFFNSWRGEFDKEALAQIANMINADKGGLKVRFTHPTVSDDGLGKFLGRGKNARISETINRKGKAVACVRADLHFDRTAMDTPPSGGKPLGEYVMDLAESDPDALSSSLVLKKDEALRLNSDGTRQKDADGNNLPPLWKPIELHASDIVDEGDAVDGLLSSDVSDRLPHQKIVESLDRMFPGQSREVVESRAISFLNKYLDLRHPKKLAAGEVMICPECGMEYSDGEKYCHNDGAKLEPQSEMSHGDENMSQKQPEKPVAPEKKEPEKLTVERAEEIIRHLREESAKDKETITTLTAEVDQYKPLASKVVDLEKKVAELSAKNDRIELDSLLDGELFHKWRTDEKEKLSVHLLKCKAVSDELYREGLEEVKNRADVKPRLNQVGAHIKDQGEVNGTFDEIRMTRIKGIAEKHQLDTKTFAGMQKAIALAEKEFPEIRIHQSAGGGK